MKRVLLGCTIFLLVLSGGCGGYKDLETAYEEAGDFINPDPVVELTVCELDDESCEKLATLFGPVDMRIMNLRRSLSVQEDFPTDRWFEMMQIRYPWLTNIVVLDVRGSELARRPNAVVKPVSFEGFVDRGDEWLDRKLRAAVVETELGPEVVMANPFERNREWLGLTVVHFDPRSLMRFCPYPELLYVFTPQTMVWNPSDESVAASLLAPEWEEILEDDVQGKLDTPQGSYTWLARKLGGQPIIYAVRDN